MTTYTNPIPDEEKIPGRDFFICGRQWWPDLQDHYCRQCDGVDCEYQKAMKRKE